MKRKRDGRLYRSVLAMLLGGFVAPAVAPHCGSAAAQSLPETVEAINKARVSTRILFITAHPDDEWSSLLTYLSRGLDADVALLTITRGQGGQNAIGPEQGGPLGVIRTEELLAAGKDYGVRQFFTRAMDTGYVKTPEQARQIWGGLALEDMVRVIRTFRPQVVINGWGGVHSGHGHHQESGILTPQAVAAAADPKVYPEQIAEGLPAWKVEVELRMVRDNKAGGMQIPTNNVSPVWGKSYTDMGMEGHANHRSQGTPAFFGNPFFRRPIFLVTESEKGETDFEFNTKLDEPITSLAARFPTLRTLLAPALASADAHLAASKKAALGLDRTAAAKSLAEAAKLVVGLQQQIMKQGGAESPQALWEVEQVQKRIDLALKEDIALPIEAQAERHEVVAGESFSVNVNVGQAGALVVSKLYPSSMEVPPGWTARANKSTEDGSQYMVNVPADAKPPSSPADAILPFPPPLVCAAVSVEVNGYAFKIEEPVQSVEASTTGIHTYPLTLVPAVTLTVDPQQIMVPVEKAAEPVTLLARVRYHGTKAAKVAVGLDAPQGWTIAPVEPLEFSGAGDQLIRFLVTPPAHAAPGAYSLHPFGQIGNETFHTSLEPIPTLPTRNWSEPADATVHVMDLVVPRRLRVGYVTAENDPLPEILRQIGVQVDLLDEVALAFGDLGDYDAIVVGIRAYELRGDLFRSNARLLEYVQRGGTLLVQYQRDAEWTKEAPYPAKMPESTSRVTDANSPVRFLAPDSPLLNAPNKITLADFEGWVQERGLYFLGTIDPHYTAVLGLKDPGESEATGALVYAKYGKGVYIYTGLSFFRELPAGVPGAYRLFVNLLSQTKY
ncbi:MAG: PIG-L family deacetylase [Candidatus Acidiferrales bacterium]